MKSPFAVRAATIAAPLLLGSVAGAAEPPVTFTRDVAPVLFKHCATCHRPGEIAPMSLMTYEDVRPWAKSIRDKVIEGAMPPWHADPAHGRFKNDRRLTQQEKDVLVRWVTGGAAKGDPKDLPPTPSFPSGWTIGQPDVVVSLPVAFPVPADGEVPYQYVEVPTQFTEDRWIQAMEIRPGNRSVVHHVLVFCREPNPAPRELAFRTLAPGSPTAPAGPATPAPERPTATGGRRGPLLATTAPGMNATVFAPGTAMLIKAGSVLTFQMHYTTNGQAATDQTSIGFILAKRPPDVEVRATAFTNGRLVIPPGAPDHAVESGVSFLYDVTLYSIFPHTHLRGKSWDYRVTYPDGRTETVLSVPQYDFNWQTDYVFAEPLKLPPGSVLKAVARYDNSSRNPANPDPKAEVRWGEQTWEEMQYTGLNYSIDKKPGAAAPTAAR
jgi:mono/diheme cytochrome c family protein